MIFALENSVKERELPLQGGWCRWPSGTVLLFKVDSVLSEFGKASLLHLHPSCCRCIDLVSLDLSLAADPHCSLYQGWCCPCLWMNMRHACQGWIGSLALGLLFFRTHASSLRAMAWVRCGFILTVEKLGCWNVVHGLVFATSGPRSWPFRIEFLVFCGLL